MTDIANIRDWEKRKNVLCTFCGTPLFEEESDRAIGNMHGGCFYAEKHLRKNEERREPLRDRVFDAWRRI
jgi:hypothetical protein